MKNHEIGTPGGTNDRLFGECASRRALLTALGALFRRRGCEEVMTPSFEYYDVVRAPQSVLPQERLFKFVGQTGKLLVLRPDMTTPIARIAATKLPDGKLPCRLYYLANVFRSYAPDAGFGSEIMQAGVEYIGAEGLRADLEMVVTAADALSACGLTDYQIEIGHAGFFKALAAELRMDEDTFERMRLLTESKNFAGLGDLLAPYGDAPAAAVLRRVARLFGGEEILRQAEELTGGMSVGGTLGCLREIMDGVRAAGIAGHVRFDLGLVQDLSYYTGIVIRGYASGIGRPVLSGGRYDALIGAFGRALPAVGFAMDIDALADGAAEPEASGGTLLAYADGNLRAALSFMDENPGCALAPTGDPEEARRFAASRGYRRLFYFSDGERSEVRL